MNELSYAFLIGISALLLISIMPMLCLTLIAVVESFCGNKKEPHPTCETCDFFDDSGMSCVDGHYLNKDHYCKEHSELRENKCN